MKTRLVIAVTAVLLSSCGGIHQSDSSDSLASLPEPLTATEKQFVGRWDFYRIRDDKNAMPLYGKSDLDNFSVSRKHDWMEFSTDRRYRECFFGVDETKALTFEGDDNTLRYQLLNENGDVMRIEHYILKGEDTMLTSMDNAQFVWVRR
jgi:hypothetical protein